MKFKANVATFLTIGDTNYKSEPTGETEKRNRILTR